MSITRNGVNLTDMFQSGSGTLNDFTGFGSYSTTNLAWERQNPLGITRNGTDVGTQFMAKYVDYTSSQNGVTIPTGVNQIKVLIIGGGGGGGGGCTNIYDNVGDTVDNGFPGGGGGGGGITVATIPIGNANSYTVSVGQGGMGATTLFNYGAEQKYTGATAGQTTNFFIVNIGNFSANGGNPGGDSQDNDIRNNGSGGIGGNGATAQSMITNVVYSAGGNKGNDGGNIYEGYGGNVINSSLYPIINTSPNVSNIIGIYGNGGKGGQPGRENRVLDVAKGSNGRNGFCRVYFLY